MESNTFVYIGVDVAKDKLDISVDDRVVTIENEAKAIGAFIKGLRKLPGEKPFCLVCEATGPYHRKLSRMAHKMGMPLAVAAPFYVKRFREAMGRMAKTDKIDARTIAAFANAMRLKPSEEQAYTDELQELVSSRDLLVKMQVEAKNRLATLDSPMARKELEAIIANLEKRIEALNKAAWKLIRSVPLLAHLADALMQVKGLGERTVPALLAYLPEVGTLGRRRAASVVGLCPYAQESGTYVGQRHIRGGRKRVRNALYMPTIVAMRYDEHIKAHNHTLRNIAHKPGKVVIVALMRKYLTHLESVARAARQTHRHP